MVSSPKIERINALDPYFPKNKKLNGEAKIDFELVRDFKLNQIVTWPTRMNNLKKYFKSLSINSDYLKPGIVCQYSSIHVVRVEPYKWWVLDDYSNVFGGIDRDFVMDIDLSHSFVQIKISGIFSTRILTHFVPVDIREKQFPVGKLITTSIQQVSVKLWRNQNHWKIFLPRSYSESIWQLISETAAQYEFKKE